MAARIDRVVRFVTQLQSRTASSAPKQQQSQQSRNRQGAQSVRRLANAGAAALLAVLGLTSVAAAGTTRAKPVADCAALSVGANGPAVATIQHQLHVAADGDFGPLTKAALRRWQHKHKVRATGVVDAATWRAMPKPVALAACGQPAHGQGVALACTTLHVGSNGPAVMVAQKAVRVVSDGAFGPKTRAAVVAAQRKLRLPGNGIVDAATWAALGRTGTPACVAAVGAAQFTSATPTPAPSGSASPSPSPTPTPAPRPADWAAQQKVRAQVVALAAKLPSHQGASTDQVALKALSFAQSQKGKPYAWGGVGPKSYDCSGLVLAAYRSAGITMPRVAADQYGTGVSVPLDQVQQGDLLFYASDVTKPDTIYHVVVYNGAGTIVDAPYTGAFVGTRALWTQDLLPVAWRPSGALSLPLKQGATGWTVAQLQQALDRGGAKLTVDGAFGPATGAAVSSWQTAHKLKNTGVVDVATWLTLS
jgi:peptidoglycan hydrolase-like protein with peptidoglycan-binding domain